MGEAEEKNEHRSQVVFFSFLNIIIILSERIIEKPNTRGPTSKREIIPKDSLPIYLNYTEKLKEWLFLTKAMMSVFGSYQTGMKILQIRYMRSVTSPKQTNSNGLKERYIK